MGLSVSLRWTPTAAERPGRDPNPAFILNVSCWETTTAHRLNARLAERGRVSQGCPNSPLNSYGNPNDQKPAMLCSSQLGSLLYSRGANTFQCVSLCFTEDSSEVRGTRSLWISFCMYILYFCIIWTGLHCVILHTCTYQSQDPVRELVCFVYKVCVA